MIQEMLKAFMFIFVAEMGDKTQILAMAFATKYPVKKVLLGIFIGAFLNHGLAVLLGNYLSTVIPINFLQIIAGFAFIGFALWTLYSEDEDEEETKKSRFGPVFTVSLAFFLGELGDKTQLTAITLAAEANYPLFILCGTVLGMIVTGGIGIFVGKTIGAKIPEYIIKIAATSIFMFFGILKLSQTLPREVLTPLYIVPFFTVLGILTFLLLHNNFKKRKRGIPSGLKSKAQSLFEYYHKIAQVVEKICLGEPYCGECDGDNCIIGYIKTLIKNGLEQTDESIRKDAPTINTLKKFDRKRLLEALIFTVEFKQENPSSKEPLIDKIQENLEILLFGQAQKEPKDLTVYLTHLKSNEYQIE